MPTAVCFGVKHSPQHKIQLVFYLSSMTIIKMSLHIFLEIYYKNLIVFFYGDDNVLSWN